MLKGKIHATQEMGKSQENAGKRGVRDEEIINFENDVGPCKERLS
jgi:hypothetical protein